MKREKVILDTNLWISFLISKRFALLEKLIIEGKIKLIFSKELIDEFISVSRRPKCLLHNWNYFVDKRSSYQQITLCN